MRTPEQIIGKDRLVQLIFEGYAVMPIEPTEAMSVNGGLAFEDAAFGEGKLVFEAAADAYRMMVKVATMPKQ